ncbi:MAG: hypothetical protein AAF436_13745 [Myxococcota bacterium]
MVKKGSKELEFQFNALPESVRERFVQCIAGKSRPAPLFSVKKAPGWLLTLGLIGGLVGIAFAFVSEFGSNIQPPHWIAIYAAGAAFVAVPLFTWLASRARRSALPFEFGTYLFPLDLVYAQGPRLRTIPMSSLSNFNGTHHSTNGIYTHTNFDFWFEGGHKVSFVVKGKDAAEKALGEFRASQQALAQASQQQNYELFAALDPFFEVRAKQGLESLVGEDRRLSSGGKYVAEEVPGYLNKPWLTALGIALLLAPAIWFARNWASDGEFYARVVRSQSPYTARAYVSSGATRHRDEVENVLLPKFAFEQAKESNSVTKMRSFIRDFPESEYVPEARDVIHERYVEAERLFRQSAAQDDPALLDLMSLLFQYLEVNGSPKVAVRFSPPANESLKEVDELLKTRPKEEGMPPISPVSPSFTSESSEVRENYIVTGLQKGFRSFLPQDVLDLTKGAAIPPGEDVVFDEPTIAVAYAVVPSGAIYTNEQNSRGFVGIEVEFLVSMEVPGHEPHRFLVSVEPPDHFTVQSGGIQLKPSDYIVYDVMAKLAFEKLDSKLAYGFFGTREEEEPSASP